jgi:UDP-GlcNAc:undecaprenyl-phosphate GlcNAc-1-phosphate transferase
MNPELAPPLAALLGAAAALAAAHLLAPLARRLGFVDPPGPRKLHTAPVPLVGGAALLLAALVGFVASAALGAGGGGLPKAALFLPLAMLAVGVLDDARGKSLRPGTKALLTLVALAAALADSGLPLVAALLAIAPLFALVHATNTIDHVDGLCAGTAALALLDASAAALLLDEHALAIRLGALGGGALGFLFLNFPRARVFLGDGGTLLLGGVLAGLWLHWRRPEVFLLACVPLADFLSVAWLRVRAGVRPWIGDRRHVTHRLIASGVAPTRAVLALLCLQAAAASTGAWLLAHPLPLGTATAIAAAVVVLVALAFAGLAREHA